MEAPRTGRTSLVVSKLTASRLRGWNVHPCRWLTNQRSDVSAATHRRGSRIDVNPLSLMHILERVPLAGRPVFAIGLLVRTAVLAQEPPTAILAGFDDYFSLVHHAMVRAAERYPPGNVAKVRAPCVDNCGGDR